MFIETYILNERCLEMILSDGEDSGLIARDRLFGEIRVEKSSRMVQSWKLFSSDEFSPCLCVHYAHVLSSYGMDVMTLNVKKCQESIPVLKTLLFLVLFQTRYVMGSRFIRAFGDFEIN